MNKQEFLDKLREVAKTEKFELSNGRKIRLLGLDTCPINALGGNWHEYDGGLNLECQDGYSLCNDIIAAADDMLEQDKILRAEMLEICGLVEI